MSQTVPSPAGNGARQHLSTHVQSVANTATGKTAQAHDRRLSARIEETQVARDLIGVATLAGACLTEAEAIAVVSVLDDVITLLVDLRLS